MNEHFKSLFSVSLFYFLYISVFSMWNFLPVEFLEFVPTFFNFVEIVMGYIFSYYIYNLIIASD